MSLSVAAELPVRSLPDQFHYLDNYPKPEKVHQTQQFEQTTVPAKPTTIEQIERLEATGRSVAEIATALGLTATQVDDELGIETASTSTAIPTAIDVKV